MNQRRNIISNIIINVFIVSLLAYMGAMLCKTVIGFIACFLVFSLITFFIFRIINLTLGVDGLYSDRFKIVPIHGLFVLIQLLFYYIKGEVKMIKNKDFRQLTRYNKNSQEIKIFKFNVFRFYVIQTLNFTEINDSTINKVNDEINYINRYEQKLHTGKENYKTWNGALDAEAERICTIDKIIKS